jgi:hypothetical protein
MDCMEELVLQSFDSRILHLSCIGPFPYKSIEWKEQDLCLQ